MISPCILISFFCACFRGKIFGLSYRVGGRIWHVVSYDPIDFDSRLWPHSISGEIMAKSVTGLAYGKASGVPNGRVVLIHFLIFAHVWATRVGQGVIKSEV